MTDKEVSRARGLIGALQWPAGQGVPPLCSKHINSCRRIGLQRGEGDERAQQGTTLQQAELRRDATISEDHRRLAQHPLPGVFRCCTRSTTRLGKPRWIPHPGGEQQGDVRRGRKV